MLRLRRYAAALTVVAAVFAATASPAFADIPIGQPINGTSTWYNDAGYGACGTQINAATDWLVAAPYSYWTTPNPNNDPICALSIEVTYQGQTIRVPVRDKCPSCDAGHIDLSAPAFGSLANRDIGVINVTWKFVN